MCHLKTPRSAHVVTACHLKGCRVRTFCSMWIFPRPTQIWLIIDYILPFSAFAAETWCLCVWHGFPQLTEHISVIMFETLCLDLTSLPNYSTSVCLSSSATLLQPCYNHNLTVISGIFPLKLHSCVKVDRKHWGSMPITVWDSLQAKILLLLLKMEVGQGHLCGKSLLFWFESIILF